MNALRDGRQFADALRREIAEDEKTLALKRRALQEVDRLLADVKRFGIITGRPPQAVRPRKTKAPARARATAARKKVRDAGRSRPSADGPRELTPKVLAYIQEHHPCTPAEVAEALGVHRTYMQRAVKPLLASGQVTAEGFTRKRIFHIGRPAAAAPPHPNGFDVTRAIDKVLVTGASHTAAELLRKVRGRHPGTDITLKQIEAEVERAAADNLLYRFFVPETNEVRYRKLGPRRTNKHEGTNP